MKMIAQIFFLSLLCLPLYAQKELSASMEGDTKPRYDGCETINNEEMRDICATKKMYEYIYSRLDYPELAKRKKLEATVIAEIHITASGKIKEIKILDSPGEDFSEAAIEVLEYMPSWIPAQRNGKPIDSFVDVPIEFRL